jgi:hypothetical protein
MPSPTHPQNVHPTPRRPSPILQLPYELLAYIIELSISASSPIIDEYALAHATRKSLLSTCRFFKVICRETSRQWTTVYIPLLDLGEGDCALLVQAVSAQLAHSRVVQSNISVPSSSAPPNLPRIQYLPLKDWPRVQTLLRGSEELTFIDPFS